MTEPDNRTPRHNHELNGMVRDWKAPSPGVKLTALTLATYFGLNHGEWVAWPGTKRLAEDTGYNEGTVREHLRVLEQVGFIERRPMMRSAGRGRAPDELLFTLGTNRGNSDIGQGPTAGSGGDQPRDQPGPTAAGTDLTLITEEVEELVKVPPPPATTPTAERERVTKIILDEWWEERSNADNPVGQPYLACRAVVLSMLRNGVAMNRIEWALRNSPVVSTAALEMAIQRRLNPQQGRPQSAFDRAIATAGGPITTRSIER